MMNLRGDDRLLLDAVDPILGYLNFSSGAFDPKLYLGLNRIWSRLDGATEDGASRVTRLHRGLQLRLEQLVDDQPQFADCRQARRTLGLVFERLVPGFLEYHRDLVFHHTVDTLFNSFLIGRLIQAALQALDETADEILVPRILQRFNDYVGYRPVASLESRNIEPYAHEWIRPVPLYIRQVGVACDRYEALVTRALEILRQTDESILRQAHFSLDRLDELAWDPRAFDFDHPANKRPNHHFGQWDVHSIGPDGFYHRFVLHSVTLDALLARADEPLGISREELLDEAAAVLGGTMLMASGLCGDGPDTFDSNTTLDSLLPAVACYRDRYYDRLLSQRAGPHQRRLQSEAIVRRQPFGGARQSLNARLAHCRAAQLVHVHLASIYARMGYLEAAQRQADIVPVSAARMLCQIDCLLSAGRLQIEAGELEAALRTVPEIMDLVQRGIECGAIVDPWNLLGFDGHFSLFPAPSNSVPDHRVDQLVDLVESVLGYCSQLWAEAASRDLPLVCGRIKLQLEAIAHWWYEFAPHEVSSSGAINPKDLVKAADHVAQALTLWHRGGAAAGDVEFWSKHAKMFDSPQAYALVIEALLQRDDVSTVMALLIHWLSRSEAIPLLVADCSFHQLVARWLLRLKEQQAGASAEESAACWARVCKFYDFAEVNADEYWRIPEFKLGPQFLSRGQADEDDAEGSSDPSSSVLYRAAYEGVVWRDTADDGREDSLYDPSLAGEDELESEVNRIGDRLEFFRTLAAFWHHAATMSLADAETLPPDERARALAARREAMSGWVRQALLNRERLADLLESVSRYRLPRSSGDSDSLIEYDRHRLFKESLMDRIIATAVETDNAIRVVAAHIAAIDHAARGTRLDEAAETIPAQREWIPVLAAMVLGDPARVRLHFDELVESLQSQPLLYVPLARGGNAQAIVTARSRQDAIRELLACLPRLGLLRETHDLCALAMTMERNQRISAGAVTEFDELFRIALTSMVEALALASRDLAAEDADGRAREQVLFESLELVTESMLLMWLEHSRTLRLSVLEKVSDKASWTRLVEFIKQYGEDVFTQRILQLGNLRAILHQGAETWLRQMQASGEGGNLKIIREIDRGLSLQRAARYLTLVFEAVIENYNEYRDYNGTTTQSDRGELLYMLLDFLRLRVRYDRVNWHLRPVTWTHRRLVELAENRVARLWRRSLAERVEPEAANYWSRYEKLQAQYAMQMMTVGDRLSEKFVHPMRVDRMRALVPLAMDVDGGAAAEQAFEMLEREANRLAQRPTAIGIDPPPWLAALEESVDVEIGDAETSEDHDRERLIPTRPLRFADLCEQLEQLPRRP